MTPTATATYDPSPFPHSLGSSNGIVAKVCAGVGSVTAIASAILLALTSQLIPVGMTFASLPPILPIALCALGATVAIISIVYLCTKKAASTVDSKSTASLFPSPTNPSVHYPLLENDSKEVYNLQLFTQRPLNNDIYDGGNRVEILSPEGETICLPRTLYHVLFIYFCLDSEIDREQFPLIDLPFSMNSKIDLDPDNWFEGELKEGLSLYQYSHSKQSLETSKKNLDLKILSFFKDKKLNQLSWNDTEKLIDELTLKFESIYNEKNDLLTDDTKSNLWKNFYVYCFNAENNGSETFKSLVTQALALEWTAPANSEVFYRTSHLTNDNIVAEDNTPYSLSFSSSLFSGIVFEGAFGGTCAYSYYTQSLCSRPKSLHHGKQLYALQIPATKVNKYFFSPLLKDYELLPLTAKGEFSHPRLRFFASAKDRVKGVQGSSACALEVAKFTPTDKIPDQKSYEAKVIKLFQKNIKLLGSTVEMRKQ